MNSRTRKMLRDSVTRLVEELSADAVIISATYQCRRGTESVTLPWGNMHTCRGLAEFTCAQICDTELDEEDESEEEQTDG